MRSSANQSHRRAQPGGSANSTRQPRTGLIATPLGTAKKEAKWPTASVLQVGCVPVALAIAEGAPTATVVIDGSLISPADLGIFDRVRAVAAYTVGWSTALKYALVRPGSGPTDLEYSFAQCLPWRRPRFDLGGSCGHSLLASVLTASRWGLLPPLKPGATVMVRIMNTSEQVACLVQRARRADVVFTASFLFDPPREFDSILPSGQGSAVVDVLGRPVNVSYVRLANPYVFVDGASLGLSGPAELFGAGHALSKVLEAIRVSAAPVFGLKSARAFPKVAVLVRDEKDVVAVRALSVPTWHPSLALTGAICAAGAAAAGSTVVSRLVSTDVAAGQRLSLRVPAGSLHVGWETTEGRLSAANVADKRVRLLSSGVSKCGTAA